ncbi:MAG: hypothetical protein ACI8Y7_000696 [Candidatus Woesearchaeota archaeon]|jgi:hypothetical protein
MAETKSAIHIVVTIFLFIVTVSLFSYWGYLWVSYLLGLIFDVAVGKTVFDMIVGLIAMAASVLIFTGGIYSLLLKQVSSGLLKYGAIFFIIKNVFDVASNIFDLTNVATVMSQHIASAAIGIGGHFLQTAFWIFILIYFTRDEFTSKLS